MYGNINMNKFNNTNNSSSAVLVFCSLSFCLIALLLPYLFLFGGASDQTQGMKDQVNIRLWAMSQSPRRISDL